MKSFARFTFLLSLLGLAWSAIGLARPVYAAPFAPGNIVVLRIGDGGGALSAAAAAVFLDEYTPAGTLVQTIAMPTADSGSDQILTISGTATSEGGLALSPNRDYLTLAGYDAAPGTANVATTTSATVNRIIGRVDIAGTVDTTTRISNGFSASNIRGAVTSNGTELWASGNGGVRYTTLGGAHDASVQLSASPTNVRWVHIYKGQLYVSSGAAGFVGVNTVGTGLQTTSGQTTTLLQGATNAYSFVLFDMDAGVAGVDTLYIANQTSPGLLKYSFDGATWTARGSLTGVLTGLTAIRTGSGNSGVDLYATVGTAAGNTIYRVSDAAAFNANITNSGTAVTAGTLIATAAANTVFRGIAFTPGSPSQVAPTAVTLSQTGVQTAALPTLPFALAFLMLAIASLTIGKRK